MSRTSRAVTATTVASFGLLVGGLVTIGALSGAGTGAAPTTTATAPTTTAAADVITVAPDPSLDATTTSNPGFADGAAASLAAEELLPGYIASQYVVEVTDPACSEAPTGAVGETFACYALKPGDLVVALRATIGEQRLVTLELITNQEPTTTTTTTTTEPPADSDPAVETTDG